MDSREHNGAGTGKPHRRGLLGLDIETTGLDHRTDDIVVVAVAFEDDREELFDPLEEGNFMETLFRSWGQNVIIGHNLSFDLRFINEKYGIGYPESSWDTMLAERLLTAGLLDEEVNLKFVAGKYLGMEMDKTLTTTFKNFREMTPEQIEYVKKDVRSVVEIAKQQRVLLEQHKLGKVWELERACLPIFTEMVRKGIMVDRTVLDPLIAEAEARHAILGKQLTEIMTPLVEWKRIEKRDEMQADLDAWLNRLEVATLEFEEEWILAMPPLESDLFDTIEYVDHPERREGWNEKWLDTKINRKDKKPEGMRRYVKAKQKEWREKTDENGKLVNKRPDAPKLDTSLINLNSPFQPKDAFRGLGVELPDMKGKTLLAAVPDAPEEAKRVLTMFAEWKKLEKLLSSFGKKIIELMDDEGALHGDFKQIGTDTGRPTCSKPNMLQMPSKKTDPRFRSAFVPRQGNLFVVADYSQIELRIMAELSGDPAMVKAFTDGLDLHSYTASLMFNVPLEDVDDRQRMTAKTINFGILYGMGPKKLRETLAGEGIEMSMEEATRAVKQWKNSYRLAAAKIQEWQTSVLKLGYTETPLGRKRFFDLSTDDRGEIFGIQRAGANHVIQGTSADITKLAMVLIHDMLDGCGTIVLQVYDEIVVEVEEQYATWAKEVVEIAMLNAAEAILSTVPVAVDAVVSRSWNEDDAI